MIQTTCQDETVEALMEYERSVPVKDMVCTPYILTTAQEWYSGNMHALIKLYGSCTDSQRMLLSEQDFQEYYPAEPSKKPTTSEPKTVSFLREIFHRKNLLFLGMNPMQDGQLFVGLSTCHINLIKCRNTVSGIHEFVKELRSVVEKRESGEERSDQGYEA
ncbi:MAG: SIR2 family protein [bacterium]|nr:SIR2 family protein [bacterium]MCM1374885.1 SIR2 family protein [Muribaculum sp.]